MPFLQQIKTLKESSNYPYNLPAFRGGVNITFKENVTFLIGDNGAGKSTLIESIAYHCGFNPLGGNRNHIFRDEVRTNKLLDLRISWMPKVNTGFFLRAENLFNFGKYLEEQAKEFGSRVLSGYGGKLFDRQSHGESFLSLFKNQFNNRRKNIYLIDEPEAALSPQSQYSFIHLLHELQSNDNAQFLIVTHSPIIMAYPKAEIIQLSDSGIEKVSYGDIEHVNFTRDFLNNREAFLKHILI